MTNDESIGETKLHQSPFESGKSFEASHGADRGTVQLEGSLSAEKASDSIAADTSARTRHVVLARGEERRKCRLSWRSAWNDHCLELDGPHGVLSGTGSDQFEALVDLRRKLEETGWLIAVQGARRDTYPSGMARDMAQGERIYVCRPGEPARTEDLVDTLADAEIEQLATVDDQRRFWEAWLG